MIRITQSGNFDNIERFLKKTQKGNLFAGLQKYGEMGVTALANATPKETGKTAASWRYEIKNTSDSYTIEWYNTNENRGVNIAVILQYGHGTGTGGYVQGRDYINPAIKPIFEQIANAAWKEVTSA